MKLPPPPSSPSAEQVVWQRERFPSAGGRPQGRAEGGGSCPAPPLRQPGRLPRPRREGCPVSPMQGGGCAAGGGVISMLGSARTFSWGGGTGLHPPLLSGRVSPPLAQPRGTCGPPPSGGGCPQRAAPPPAPRRSWERRALPPPRGRSPICRLCTQAVPERGLAGAAVAALPRGRGMWGLGGVPWAVPARCRGRLHKHVCRWGSVGTAFVRPGRPELSVGPRLLRRPLPPSHAQALVRPLP